MVKMHKRIKPGIIALAVVFIFASGYLILPNGTVYADKYTDQINALQNQLNSLNAKTAELSKQADTLSNKIAELQTEQDQIQAGIDLNNAKVSQLNQQIDDNTKKLDQQQKVLAGMVVDEYVNGDVSAVTVLAGSHSIGDLVEAQTRQAAARDEIDTSSKQIRQLKLELEQQKSQVESLLAQQQAQKGMLAKSQQDQKTLLDQTQGQEASYQDMVAKTNDEIKRLQAERAALYASSGAKITSSANCGGGYPYCKSNGYVKDQLVNIGTGQSYAQECVSYVEWHLANLGIQATGSGDAGQWWNTWSSKRSSTPNAGRSVVVWSVAQAPNVGHVAWVDSVDGDNVYISQYNWDLRGSYSTAVLRLSEAGHSYLGFLNF